MRRTIFAMAGVAGLVFAVEARASDRGGAWATEGFHDESSRAVSVASQPSDERITAAAEATACDDGGASGEPSAKPEQTAGQEEFLRMIWTAS